VTAEGTRADHVFAFQRAHRGVAMLVVVPRLTCGFGGDLPIREAWGDTILRPSVQPDVAAWRCELGGQVVQSRGGALALSDLTARLPVAVLTPHY
jgi:maltooligosyltrehalose synthase